MSNINITQTLICKDCKRELDVTNFQKHRRRCNKCRGKKDLEWRIKTGRNKNKDGSHKKHSSTENLIGKKFNKLTVIEFLGIKDNPSQPGKRASFFRCLCDCGNHKIVTRTGVKTGGVKSCGCLCKGKIGEKSKNWTGYKGLSGSSWNKIVRNCLGNRRVKRRNLEFSITKEFIWELYEKQDRKCALSNLDIILDIGSKTKNQTASLDRIDSSKGYTIDNVQWVHKDVNNIKQDFNQDYFIELCRRISDKVMGLKLTKPNS